MSASVSKPSAHPRSRLYNRDEMPRKNKEDTSFGPRLTALRKTRGLPRIQLTDALINSLAAVAAPRKAQGGQNGR